MEITAKAKATGNVTVSTPRVILFGVFLLFKLYYTVKHV